MAVEVIMPRLSDSMEEGTVLRWLKSVGDEVAIGDELVEIETDKANMVHEADAAGTLIEIVAAEGETLRIGAVIARVGEAGEAPGGKGAAAAAAAEPAAPATSPAREAAAADAGPVSPSASRSAAGDGRVKASPLARRMARARGLDLAAITGSGPSGRVVKEDVERAIEAGDTTTAQAMATPGLSERADTAKGTTEVVAQTKLQRTVARRMAESKATVPHFYLSADIDMSRCVATRAQVKAAAREADVVPSLNDMVVKACAIALREHPRANGAYRDGRLELYSRVNVGVAVAANDALLVPTVFDADQKGLRQIAAEVRALSARVREGSITPPELAGGTFTVSNLGMYGISNFAAVINPPQAAILAVGQVEVKPVVRSDEVTTAHLMSVTLACDHRILYGAEGAEFLARVRALLEEPMGLAL
jgi:pyruvate dehydrogenase E2 component (dihydrolipoamide acetyltransferase)